LHFDLCQFARGFGVEEYTPLLASTIANETRLKTASEFGPIKEWKGFKKVFLQPGDSRRVTLELDQRSFAFFDTTKHLWVAEPGIYSILVGASSQDIQLSGQFALTSEVDSQP